MNKDSAEISQLVIKPFEEKQLDEVVHLHQAVLGYTLNSQLGAEHLAFMYRQMYQNSKSYIGVACLADQPVGVVSGTTDLQEIRNTFLNSLSPKHFWNIISRLLRKPSLLLEFYKNSQIDKPVYINGESVKAILTTIAVNPAYQGLGIGANLVSALEDFFSGQGIRIYRLDTLVSNLSARAFYRKLNFDEVETRTDSVILVKRMNNA